MDEEKIQTYLELIQALFRCENGQEASSILQANPDLVDRGLMEVMGQLADYLEQRGEDNNAGWLRNMAQQLGQYLQAPQNDQNAYLTFLQTLLQTIAETQDTQVIYPLLQNNLHLLDETFLNLLQAWVNQAQAASTPEETRQLGSFLYRLAYIFHEFPFGNPLINLAIAVWGYEFCAATQHQPGLERDLASTLNNLGVAYLTQAQLGREPEANLQKAIAAYTDAATIRRQPGLERDLAGTLTNLGNAYLTQAELGREPEANLQKAIAAYTDAATIRRQPGLERDLAQTLTNLGVAYRTQAELGREPEANLQKAIANYRQALGIVTPEVSPADCLKFSRNLGNLGLKQGWWDIALEGYEQGIKAVEKTRLWAATDKEKREIQEAALGIYTGAVQAAVELNQYGRAVEFVERGKSRNLVEMLGTKDLYPEGDIPPEIKAELKRLRQEIRTEGRLLEIQGEKRSKDRLNALREELERLNEQEIEPRDPDFSRTQKVESISEEEILDLLGNNPSKAILEWYFTEDTLYTFIITTHPDTPVFTHPVALESGELRQFTAKYLALYRQRSSAWQEALPQLLEELKQILHLEEVLSQLFELAPRCQELILVPYRFLHIFPLHALLPWERFPLSFSYSPSCQILTTLKSPPSATNEQALAVQNPTQDLAYTNFEVETIASQSLPNMTILAESSATREAFLDQPLAETNYLHLSCHGYFNFNTSLNSALLLAGCKLSAPIPEDEPNRYLPLPNGSAIDLSRCLTLGDIFELDLRRCHLVTLSACETGFSDIASSQNDDYIGLPAGFLYAGTPSVISTLWAVSDRATAILLIRFYELYQDRNNPITYRCPRLALYHAQAWLRDAKAGELLAWVKKSPPSGTRLNLKTYFATMPETDQPFNKPHYWAAFTYVGL
jgi:CHAT domain-containing protein